MEQHEQELQEIEARLRERHQITVDMMFEDGSDLLRAQEIHALHGYGDFQQWVKDHAPFSKTEAYQIMQATRVFAGIDCPNLGQSMAKTTIWGLAAKVEQFASAADIDLDEAKEVYPPLLQAMEQANRGQRVKGDDVDLWISNFERLQEQQERQIGQNQRELEREDPGPLLEGLMKLEEHHIMEQDENGVWHFSRDLYYTPRYAVDYILPYLPAGATIWEPACGIGHISDYLEEKAFDVIATDAMRGTDFLTCDVPEFDVILTNPPWSKANEFIRRCDEIGKPFALLMSVDALGTTDRQETWRRGLELLVPDNRIIYFNTARQPIDTARLSAWFCRGLLPQPITFV